jgi:HEAT repeat protein
MIEKALQDDQQTVRLTAAAVLAKWGRGDALDRVRDTAATAANPEQRADALRALGELQDRRSITIVRQALHDGQPSVRGAAATAIGKLAVTGTSALLAELLHDSIPAVRAAAATGLGDLHEADSLPLLRKALNDPNPAVRGAVVSSLLKLKTPYAEVASVVNDLAHNSDPGIRAMTARVLAVSTEPPAKEVLKLLLVDPLPRPRIAAARVLGQMGDEKQIAILKKALRDSDDAVRATAGAAVAPLL